MTAGRHALLIGINSYPYVAGARLAGARNDVVRVGRLLRDRFGFPDDHLLLLVDEEATQAAIRAAFEELLGRVGREDSVVCFYSGHGSRLAAPERSEGWLESIVPHDSGRGEHPNRDIADVEIDRWVQRLNETTPHVTLIFDCCYSGSVTRDPFATATRGIEADRRRPQEPFAGGFVRGRRQAVTVAACRSDEEANEHRVAASGSAYAFGALSYFLGRALEQTGGGATWRDLFEQVGQAVTACYPRQHPQIEGNWDQVLFGHRELRPAPYLEVLRVAAHRAGDGGEGAGGSDPDRVALAGGAAHGVREGSLWTLHPPGARQANPAARIARVRVESVAAVSCEAELEEVAAGQQVTPGQRAFLQVERLEAPGLRLRLAVAGERAAELRGRVASSDLLTEVGDDDPAAAEVRCLSPRAEVGPDDLCPHLGPLTEPTWVVVGPDGRLAVRLQRAQAGAAERLVGDLESVARYRGLLAIANPDPDSRLAGRVHLEVERWSRERQAFAAAEPEPGDGVITFGDGERADFVITNQHDAPVFLTLLQLDSDGSIVRLLPARRHPTYSPAGCRLEAGEVLRVEDYFRQDPRFRVWDGLRVVLPEGFPWAAEPGERPDSGLFHLKLMVTLEPADFELLEQHPVFGPPELRDPGPQSHPLLRLARLYACGRGERSLPVGSAAGSSATDWTTLTRPVAVRRGDGRGGRGHGGRDDG